MRRKSFPVLALVLVLLVDCGLVWAQTEPEGTEDSESEQSRQSLANDQSATQWSYLLAHQWMDYRSDEIAPGEPRPEGIARFWQGRVVMPIPKSEKLPVSLLPRLTVRYATAQDGTSGLAASDFFVLAILGEWGSGRWGLGPLITTPAADERLGLTEWTYGLSAGFSQRFFDDRLNVFLVAGQTWGRLDPFSPEDQNVESPLSINPVAVWQLDDSWYVGTADMVWRYDWHTNAWLIPLGLRLGRLFVNPKGTWNAYIEYQTSIVYKDWPGSVAKNQVRLSLGYSIPVRR